MLPQAELRDGLWRYPRTSPSYPRSGISTVAARSSLQRARFACERALYHLDPGVKGPARRVIQCTLASSGAQMFAHLPAALDGDVEAVHQARVAIRRQRSALRTFRPLLDRDSAEELRRQLLWLTDDLGAVRDADVMIELLGAELARLGGTDEGAGAGLIGLLGQERNRARDKLLEDIAGEETVRLVEAVVHMAEDPPTNRRADSPARKRLLHSVASRWERLEAEAEETGEDPAPDQLHRIRILAKRLRYAADAVAPAFGAKARRLAMAASAIQDDLGELHDAAVACEWLTNSAVHLDPRAAFTAGRLHSWIESKAANDAARWRADFCEAHARYDEWLG